MGLPRFLAYLITWPRQNSPLVRTYEAISSASVDLIWNKVVDLRDVSWHPLIARTDVPYGLVAKPGLIYQAVSRWVPLPMRIFVERVSPGEFLSVRLLVIPGVEERVTYQLQSNVCGTSISCSVMLRGWLAPLVWSIIRKPVARVATQLAIAAETTGHQRLSPPKGTCFDF